jgi:uncharacterized membrane protein YjfL (UPF0719 family)
MEMIQLIGIGVAYVVMGVIVLLLAKVALEAVTPFGLQSELTVKDNPAVGIVLVGYYAGVVIIYLGAVIGPEPEELLSSGEIARMMAIDFAYAMAGIAFLNIGRRVVDRFVLHQFSTEKEIIEDRNAGTGSVECGCLIATAMIVAGAIHGGSGPDWWSGPVSSVVFFAVGQLSLVAFGLFYQRITRYDVHAEIERDNVAAGVALGFSMVAMGIIVLRAIAVDVESWTETLTWVCIDVGLGFLLLMILRKVTDVLFLSDTTIQHEIATDQNLNAAWIEGVVATGMATIIFFVV